MGDALGFYYISMEEDEAGTRRQRQSESLSGLC